MLVFIQIKISCRVFQKHDFINDIKEIKIFLLKKPIEKESVFLYTYIFFNIFSFIFIQQQNTSFYNKFICCFKQQPKTFCCWFVSFVWQKQHLCIAKIITKTTTALLNIINSLFIMVLSLLV